VSDRELRFLEVVQALVAAPIGARLLGLGDTGAALAMPDGTAALVVSADHGSREELAEHLHTLVDRNPGLDLKLVLVGGGEAERAVLRAAQPTVMMRRVVQVFALGDDGTPWAGPRSRLDSPTGRVLTEIGSRPAGEVDRDALVQAIVRPDPDDRARAEEHHGFVAKLRTGIPWATWTLLASYAIAFALEIVWGGAEAVPTLVRMGANTDASLVDEPWRLLSSAWLHAGWLHVLVNGYVLYALGGFLERLLGWQRFTILYVAAGIGGGLASAAFSSAALSVGASGAIWGVLGASAALALRPAGLIPPAVLGTVRRNAIVNIVLNLAVSFLPQIDMMAHLGGGIVGVALVLSGVATKGLRPNEPPRASRTSTVAAIAGAALLVAAFVTAIVHGRPWDLQRLDDVVERRVDDVGLRIRVPAQLGPAEVSEEGGTTSVVFGDMLRDPLLVAVSVEAHDHGLYDPELRAEAFAAFRQQATPPTEDGAEQIGEREVDERGDMPAFREHHRYANGLHVITWHQLRPDHRVMVEGAWWGDDEEAQAVVEAAYASLRLVP